MDVKEFVMEGLKSNGFDGLFFSDSDSGCACALDDFAPCDDATYFECEPGYKVACTHNCDHGYDYEEDHWHMQPTKPAWPPVDPLVKGGK